MRSAGKILVAAVLVGTLTGLAAADFIDLEVKWSQTPWDPDGDDWLSDHAMLAGQVMADDFVCDSPDKIQAVRWWGSYLGQTVQRMDGFTGPFDISFHNSVGPHPTSLPGPLITLYTVNAQEVFVGLDNKGEPVYRYDAYLPEGEAFDQWAYSHDGNPDHNQGELFIDICKSTNEGWGWHEVVAPHPRLDFAAVGIPLVPGSSEYEPIAWQSTDTDLAFELMIPEPATLSLLLAAGAALTSTRRSRRSRRKRQVLSFN